MIQARVDAVVGRRLERSELVGIGAEVRRAEKAGRIAREADGSWDPAKVKAAWSDNTGQAQQRRARSGRRTVSMRHVQAQLEAMAEVRPRLE